jgi:signal transduction histidine kinase/ActR/RegA family two-component response regulator
MYGVMLTIASDEFALAHRFGELGLKLGQAYQIGSIDAKNYFAFATWLNPWRRHLKTNADYYRLVHSLGLESGDLTFAAYAITNYLLAEIHRGERLDQVYQEAVRYLPFVERAQDDASIKAVSACRQFILCLKGQTRDRTRLDDQQYDEQGQVAELRANNSLTVLGYCLLYKLIVLYMYGDYSAARLVSQDASPMIGRNTFFCMVYLFYDTLTISALYPALPPEEQPSARETLAARQSQMQNWSEQSPHNYRQIYLLISAETARVDRRELEAMALYDQAIQAAHENEYLHHEALANELAARFYLARGQARVAGLYIAEAHYLYGLWGATRKVQDLEQTYPDWQMKGAARVPANKPSSTRDAAGTKLDLASVLKASQAISSEIDFDRLLAQLIRIAIQNAGAERGYLILHSGSTLQIEAWGRVESQEIVVGRSSPLEEAQQPVQAIVNYVARTHEAVVLGDASTAGMFTADPEVQARRPKSVLCIPILHTSKLIGVLYLENGLVSDAFTPERLEVLTLLTSQMTISIQNAQLYADLERQTEQIRAANVNLQREMAERKRLEAQLVQSQKMEAIGRLAGGIAHDFNNLLTAILGYTNLILSELDDTVPWRHELQTIGMAGERAAALTRQLLAFSRQQVLQPELIDLNMVIAHLSSMLRRLIGEDIELMTHLGRDLSSVLADPNQIEQVVLNLVINARDSMPEGGKLTIETACVSVDAHNDALEHVDLKRGRYVLLAISDTGQGMDDVIQKRIFEPFFTTKEVGKGSGLGLAMVHGIIHQSGGQISVSSELGRGSTFTIYLPEAAEYEITARTSRGHEPTPHGNETILLVEDDAGVRRLASTVLRNYGYTVLEASDGIAAQDLLQEHRGSLDLVITDVIMPGGLSGVRLAEYVAQQLPQTKILYISGYTDNAIAEHGLLDAGQSFLQKPFTPATLARKVREVLDTLASAEAKALNGS